MDRIVKLREHMLESLHDDASFLEIPSLMRTTFNLSGTWFMEGDIKTGCFETIIPSFPEEMERLYWEKYSKNNIYTNTQSRFGRNNKPLTLDNHINQSEFLRSQYYNEMLAKVDIRYCMGLTLPSKGATWVIGWHRGPTQEAFSSFDEELLACIIPDLRRLAAVRTRLSEILRAQRCMEDTLDLMSNAIFSLSSRGRVLTANLAARRLMAMRDGLFSTANGELVPSATSARAAFTRMLAQCCLRLPGTGHRLSLDRPSGKPALLVDILPSPQAGTGGCIMVVTDPAAEPKDVVSKMRDFFGLTKAEARLAAALAHGKRLQEVAEDFSVSINTIKTQLRSIMMKTNTFNQSDIIRIVERIPDYESDQNI